MWIGIKKAPHGASKCLTVSCAVTQSDLNSSTMLKSELVRRIFLLILHEFVELKDF